MAENESDLKRIFQLMTEQKTKHDGEGAAPTTDEQHEEGRPVISSEEEMVKGLQLAGRSPVSSAEYWNGDNGEINFESFSAAVRREMTDSSAEVVELFRKLLETPSAQKSSARSAKNHNNNNHDDNSSASSSASSSPTKASLRGATNNNNDDSDLFISSGMLTDILQGGSDPMRADEVEAVLNDFRLSGVEYNSIKNEFKCKAISVHVVETMRETIDEVRQRIQINDDDNAAGRKTSASSTLASGGGQTKKMSTVSSSATTNSSSTTEQQQKKSSSSSRPLSAKTSVTTHSSLNKQQSVQVDDDHTTGSSNSGNDDTQKQQPPSQQRPQPLQQDQTLPLSTSPSALSPSSREPALRLSTRGFFCYDFISSDAVLRAQAANDPPEGGASTAASNATLTAESTASAGNATTTDQMPLMSNLFRMGIATRGLFTLSITAINLPTAKRNPLAPDAPVVSPDVGLFLLHELENGVKRVAAFTDKLIHVARREEIIDSRAASTRLPQSSSNGSVTARRASGKKTSTSTTPALTMPTHQLEEVTYTCSLELDAGTYILLPFITDCVFKPKIIDVAEGGGKSSNADSMHVPLYTRLGKEQVKLAVDYERAVHTMFDMIDLDGDNLISKDEFNLFALRTSGVEIRDDEWKLALKAFATSNGHLTRVGFFQLHVAEAVDADDDNLEDLWIPLHQMGFDNELFLANALPFRIDVQGDYIIDNAKQSAALSKNASLDNGKATKNNRKISRSDTGGQQNSDDGGGELMRFLVALPHKSISTLLEKAASRLASEQQLNSSSANMNTGGGGQVKTLASDVLLKTYRDQHRGFLVIENKRNENVIVQITVNSLDNCVISYNVASTGSTLLPLTTASENTNNNSNDNNATDVASRRKQTGASKSAIIVCVVAIDLTKPFDFDINVTITEN